jgi:hypothetical protein
LSLQSRIDSSAFFIKWAYFLCLGLDRAISDKVSFGDGIDADIFSEAGTGADGVYGDADWDWGFGGSGDCDGCVRGDGAAGAFHRFEFD